MLGKKIDINIFCYKKKTVKHNILVYILYLGYENQKALFPLKQRNFYRKSL